MTLENLSTPQVRRMYDRCKVYAFRNGPAWRVWAAVTLRVYAVWFTRAHSYPRKDAL